MPNKQNRFKHSKSEPHKNAELAKKIKIGPFIGHTNLMGRQKSYFYEYNFRNWVIFAYIP